MIRIEMYTTIITLWKSGLNKSEISRQTKIDRGTIRKIINSYEKSGIISPLKYNRSSKLEEHKSFIIELLEKDLSSVRIHEELMLNSDLKMSYSSVNRYINSLKLDNNICIRFHSDPGEEGQVDFGYSGIQPDYNGKHRKSWVFNMRLSHSRLDYFEVVFDQKVETFIRCHINAFQYFGGIPKIVKIDNLKAAILEANFYSPIYQKLYSSFASNYGFDIVPCRVRKPQEKGKTESGIKYVKNNFFAGRKFKTNNDLNSNLNNWLENKCNSRIHGTTKKVPRELFNEQEKSALLKLPEQEFIFPRVGLRKASKDCHITVDNNYYSIPYSYVGKEIDIEISNNLLKVTYDNEQIAVHPLAKGKGEFTTNESHYPKYKYHDPKSTSYQQQYKDKMLNIGNFASDIFDEIIKKHPNDWYRIIKGILSLEKQYSKTVINLSCKRALAFDALSYSKIKNICYSGCYNLPMDNEVKNHASPELINSNSTATVI